MSTPHPDPTHTQADTRADTAAATRHSSNGQAVAASGHADRRTGRTGHRHPGGQAGEAGRHGRPRPNGHGVDAGQATAAALPAGGPVPAATHAEADPATRLTAPADALPNIDPVTKPLAAIAEGPTKPRRAALVLRVAGQLLLATVLAGAVVVLAVGVGRWLLLAGVTPAGPVPAWGGMRGVVVLAQDSSGGVSLEQFLANLRTWIFRILGTLTATMLAIGGIRLAAANGEPEQVAKAKETIKSGAWGFVFTMLAPAFVTILQQLVGGSR